MLGDISTGSQTVAVDLSFPCFQGNTAPCIVFSEIITFPREESVTLTEISDLV